MEGVFGCFFSLGIILLFFLFILLASAIRIVPEFERGVVFRLGRLVGVRGPGLILLIPLIETMRKVDLRTLTMDVPPQEVITKDNVPIKVNAVAFFHVFDPALSVVKVRDYINATSQIAQTTLRGVLGQVDLDTVLVEREHINAKLQDIIDKQTDPWGVKVTIVEMKDVEIPEGMQRAMAKQAEAEREKRAKIIHADGEFQASEKLAQASDVFDTHKSAMQLRLLQVLNEIAVEKNSTIIFPVPIDFITQFMQAITKK